MVGTDSERWSFGVRLKVLCIEFRPGEPLEDFRGLESSELQLEGLDESGVVMPPRILFIYYVSLGK
jgi:hypothetical protein